MNTCETLFKQVGLKLTPRRQMLYDILDASALPMTAEDVYLQLANEGGSISLSTVYRTLELLTQKQLTQKIPSPDGVKAIYVLCTQKHRHYFYCLKCKAFKEIDCCPVHDYMQQLTVSLGCEILDHRFEMSGYCKECCKDTENSQ